MSAMNYNRLSVGMMFSCFIIWILSLCFVTNTTILSVLLVIGAICFIVSVVIYVKYARCNTCGKHLTRIWGDDCPHCKNKIVNI